MKELEDYPWFPDRLRVQQMEFIGWLVTKLNIYRPLLPLARELIASEGITQLTDLCSGAGQPALQLGSQLSMNPTVLTDLYPQDGVLPLDVMDLDDYPLRGLITMFNAFHHFTESQQVDLLTAIATQKQPALIAEILEPDLWNTCKILFTTTIGQLLLAPFVRPFRWSRLLWTYLLPVNLFTVTFDGLVSVHRAKSINQYQFIAESATSSTYHWEAIQLRSGWLTTITVLKGQPL